MGSESRQLLHPRQDLYTSFRRTRDHSASICAPLLAEDTCIQTMPDVSPPKWHLAHTSWFFETFILLRYLESYRCFHPSYDHLFNSYYVTHGDPYPRPRRGLLSRPGIEEVYEYRTHVDAAMAELLEQVDDGLIEELNALVVLGIHHEQQHQELLYTDIKHIFAQNPLRPAYRRTGLHPVSDVHPAELRFLEKPGGIRDIGHDGTGFAFDNEGPLHQVLLQDHLIADRSVTNEEYLAFIEDGGYSRPEFWMSEGWAVSRQQAWQAPLYWQRESDRWLVFGYEGVQDLDLNAPVCHVSFYEADAYARWAGARLPTEFEWECAALDEPVAGNTRESDLLRPRACDGSRQFFGDVWEWTASPYTAYPGYRPAAGSIGEYNGKFMSNQMVLRGGSCVTPLEHIRPTYRNFFYPPDRWQFSGIRLARDIDKA